MLPFSIRCNTCGEYMYRGKKFNAKKEMIKGEDYLGIRKFRFYVKCSVCSAQLVFKTDPKNSDYEMESGASRNFELWRDTSEAMDAAAKEREEEDKLDAMKSLENRTIDSKIEMDVLDALDEMKAINQRHEHVDTDALLDSLSGEAVVQSKAVLINGLTEDDERLVKSIFRKNQSQTIASDSDEERPSTRVKETKGLFECVAEQLKKQVEESKPKSTAPVILKRKRKDDVATSARSEPVPAANKLKQVKQESSALPLSAKAPQLGGLIAGYGDSDEDST